MDTEAQHAVTHRQMDASWADLAWLREQWPHTLVVKGILRPDAARAVDTGVDGVMVSNHGGRQLGESLGTIEALPDVAAKIDRQVLVDSGFRTGADVVKAVDSARRMSRTRDNPGLAAGCQSVESCPTEQDRRGAEREGGADRSLPGPGPGLQPHQALTRPLHLSQVREM